MGSFLKPLSSGGGTTAPSPSSNGSKRGPSVPRVPVKPATSTSSVGGRCACAIRRCLTMGSSGGKRVAPSGGGKRKPFELSKGFPETAAKRPFHIRFG